MSGDEASPGLLQRRRAPKSDVTIGRQLQTLLDARVAIETTTAAKAGALGFVAGSLAKATLPHSRPNAHEFERRNGNLVMSMHAPAAIGLPYGTLPRLILMHLSTEAVRTQQREINLGNTLSEFMRRLDMQATGGERGSIRGLKDQMARLFSSTISCLQITSAMTTIKNMHVASSAEIWWTPHPPGQTSFKDCKVQLGEEFFHAVTSHAIPVDLRAIKALRQSPLALDIYVWLTHRMSYLHHTSSPIPWSGLQSQFGCDYPASPQGLRDFRKQFLAQLEKVLVVYPQAQVTQHANGLILKPSPTHVPMSARRRR